MDQTADKTFYTATMARLLTNQGRYADAIRIYCYLLERSPERTDLRNALEAVTSKLAAESGQWLGVSRSIEKWVRLMLRRNAILRLRRYHG